MLFIDWNYHGNGYGKKLMEYWEVVLLDVPGYEQPMKIFLIKGI